MVIAIATYVMMVAILRVVRTVRATVIAISASVFVTIAVIMIVASAHLTAMIAVAAVGRTARATACGRTRAAARA